MMPIIFTLLSLLPLYYTQACSLELPIPLQSQNQILFTAQRTPNLLFSEKFDTPSPVFLPGPSFSGTSARISQPYRTPLISLQCEFTLNFNLFLIENTPFPLIEMSHQRNLLNYYNFHFFFLQEKSYKIFTRKWYQVTIEQNKEYLYLYINNELHIALKSPCLFQDSFTFKGEALLDNLSIYNIAGIQGNILDSGLYKGKD